MLHYKFEPFCYHGFLSTHCTMNDERSLYLNGVSLCHVPCEYYMNVQVQELTHWDSLLLMLDVQEPAWRIVPFMNEYVKSNVSKKDFRRNPALHIFEDRAQKAKVPFSEIVPAFMPFNSISQ